MLLGKQINVQKLSDGNPKASEELIVEGLHHKMYVYNERVLCDHDLQFIGALQVCACANTVGSSQCVYQTVTSRIRMI